MPDIQIGESFIGEGAEAAHINTVLGDREGPVGTAWATSLATPRAGHIPFLTVLQPGLPVKPFTLFVNKAPLEGDEHSNLTWGAAQAGVAGGVADAVADGILELHDVATKLIIAAVWVNPAARDERLVYENNRTATRRALEAGRNNTPTREDILAARHEPRNPFFTLAPTAPPVSPPAAPPAPADPAAE